MINKDVIGKIKDQEVISAYAEEPFDKAQAELETDGFRIISLEENAQLRMQSDLDSEIIRGGNYVREGVLYVPRKGIFLVKNSPILKYAERATRAQKRKNGELYLTKSQVEEALVDAILLESGSIPTERFGENGVTCYAFGDKSKAYGEFLKDHGIEYLSIMKEETLKKPFVRQVWFSELVIPRAKICDLNARYKDLYFPGRVRGIK